MPLVLWIGTRLPPTRRGVFDKALPVIGDLASIQAVVEDAIATLGRSEQGRCIPIATARAGNAVSVECLDDLDRRASLNVLGEDAPNDGGLLLVEGAQATLIALL